MTQRLHENAFTGCFDMHRNPTYQVVFKPPTFTLKHVGGGKDRGSHDFILRFGGGNKCIEIVPFPLSIEDQLGEALDILSTLRDGPLSSEMCNRIDALLNGEFEA